jgi:type VI protein secretion system component Hcp
LWRLALVAVLCLILASPAYAGYKIRMSIQGKEQGDFNLANRYRFSINGVVQNLQQVRGVQFAEAGQPLLDTATRIARGNQQREPVKITTESWVRSAQLQHALAAHEVLREVEIDLMREDGSIEARFRFINAESTGIRKIQGGAGQSAKELEEISFTYQKLEVISPK